MIYGFTITVQLYIVFNLDVEADKKCDNESFKITANYIKHVQLQNVLC